MAQRRRRFLHLSAIAAVGGLAGCSAPTQNAPAGDADTTPTPPPTPQGPPGADVLGGPDRLLFASDYPHWDYDDPSAITDLAFLSPVEKAKVLGENAKAVFDL